MGNHHLKSSIIPQSAGFNPTPTKYLDEDVSKLEGFEKSGDDVNVFISFKYIQHKYQCFSHWDKKEMKLFWNFNEKLHDNTWFNLRKLDGLGYTELSINTYPDGELRKKLSKDITLFELRVNEKIRVHGFRHKAVFYLCWLDKNHKITGK